MTTVKEIETALKTIPDPELGISIVDLGLVYGITVNGTEGTVTVKMTLTSVGCPLFHLISEPIREAVSALPGVKKVNVDLTFEPPWSVERMSPQARMQLGIE